MSDFNKYKDEAKEKWSNTEAYKEHSQKTKDYSSDKWNKLAEEMFNIIDEFSLCMKSGYEPNSIETETLVKKLQNHISENYYKCSNEILLGLGQMYVSDERFKNNIDKNLEGTASYICEAITSYCNK
jgi:hypothetical protein